MQCNINLKPFCGQCYEKWVTTCNYKKELTGRWNICSEKFELDLHSQLLY